MVELKNEHPSLFPWLLPYPGYSHFCLNLHPVYKKLYFDAGLIDLAPLMGYPQDATALKEGTNFGRNNLFKLQVIIQTPQVIDRSRESFVLDKIVE